MSELRKSVGIGGIALLGIVCCVGLPLIVAAGIGVAALAWGGAVLGGLVAVAAFSVLPLSWRARTRAVAFASRFGRAGGVRPRASDR